MLNVFDIPKPQNGFVSVFPGFSTSNGAQWTTWEKPAGITNIRIICIGGGGGGGGGFPSSTTTARGGGGGGASSTLTRLAISANLLPDLLYVSVGLGGNGAPPSTSGGFSADPGVASYVSIAPSNAAIYTLCDAPRGTGGNLGGGGGGGTPGTAPTVGGISSQLMAGLGRITLQGGSAGAAGGFNAVGGSVTYPLSGLLLSGGAGGAGGASLQGGSVSAPASQTAVLNLFGTRTGGAAGSPVGGNGADGVSLFSPLMFCGGAGGGSPSNGTDAGGRGGDGGIGCGGGGGGAGGTTGGSGAGGNGGAGLVIIYSW